MPVPNVRPAEIPFGTRRPLTLAEAQAGILPPAFSAAEFHALWQGNVAYHDELQQHKMGMLAHLGPLGSPPSCYADPHGQ